MRILHLDRNHNFLLEKLNDLGYQNDQDYVSSKCEVMRKIASYNGVVIRSRFRIDKDFIDQATNLKFIARVGAGLESIDVEYAKHKGIELISAPEGNRNAVGEHTLALLLNLFNKINISNQQIREGVWLREANRGVELDGMTVGIIGYGNMGKAFAVKLRGFNVEVICYDIKSDVDDRDAEQVELQEFFEKVDVLSLHTPWTPLTDKMVDRDFISKFKKPFWLINTARGKSVVTKDLVEALDSGKILGAGLDVLEYEKDSFEDMYKNSVLPEDFKRLLAFDNVLLSPHVAGWSVQSNYKLAKTIVDKIELKFS